MSARLAALGLLLLAACGSSAQGHDAGVLPDAGPAGMIEIGTGIVGFEAVEAEDTLELVPGPQGGGRFEGHHVWTALRLTDVALEDLSTYTVRTFDASGGLAVELEREVDNAPFEPDDAGRWVLSGIAPRLADCCQVADGAIRMVGEVRFVGGGVLTAEARARAGPCTVTCP